MRKVLVIDDETACLNLARAILAEHFQVIEAQSIKEAKKELKLHQDLRIVVSDHRLDDGFGIEFLTELKKKDPKIIAILVTGFMDHSLFSQSINDVDLFRYVAKPYMPAAFLEAVKLAEIKCEIDDQASEVLALQETARERFMVAKSYESLNKARRNFFTALFKGTGIWFLVAFCAGVVLLIFMYVFKAVLGLDFLP